MALDAGPNPTAPPGSITLSLILIIWA